MESPVPSIVASSLMTVLAPVIAVGIEASFALAEKKPPSATELRAVELYSNFNTSCH
jgi:hypothetical protein